MFKFVTKSSFNFIDVDTDTPQRIGNWSRQEKYGSANGSDRSFGSGSHSSKAPRVMYLNSHHGRQAHDVPL